MTSTQRGGEEVLKFVTCLQILLFSNNISIVYFCGRGVSGWGCFIKFIIVWSPILKLTLVKSNIFGFASVTVKQPFSLLNICMFKMKSNLKIFLIFKNGTKTCAIANLYSSKYCCVKKKLKTCQEQPHLVSDHVIMVFYKTTTWPRQTLLKLCSRSHKSWISEGEIQWLYLIVIQKMYSWSKSYSFSISLECLH